MSLLACEDCGSGMNRGRLGFGFDVSMPACFLTTNSCCERVLVRCTRGDNAFQRSKCKRPRLLAGGVDSCRCTTPDFDLLEVTEARKQPEMPRH